MWSDEVMRRRIWAFWITAVPRLFEGPADDISVPEAVLFDVTPTLRIGIRTRVYPPVSRNPPEGHTRWQQSIWTESWAMVFRMGTRFRPLRIINWRFRGDFAAFERDMVLMRLMYEPKD
jgi:hypothetical protein